MLRVAPYPDIMCCIVPDTALPCQSIPEQQESHHRRAHGHQPQLHARKLTCKTTHTKLSPLCDRTASTKFLFSSPIPRYIMTHVLVSRHTSSWISHMLQDFFSNKSVQFRTSQLSNPVRSTLPSVRQGRATAPAPRRYWPAWP